MPGTLNAEAFAQLREGRRRMNFPVTQTDLAAAAQHFRDAIAIDAGMSFEDARAKDEINDRGYPKAWGHLGYNVLATWIEGWSGSVSLLDVLTEAGEFTGNAVGQIRGELDYDTHWDRAFFLQMKGPVDDKCFDDAITEYQKAMDLNIVDMNLLLEASEAHVSAGLHDEAIRLVRRAGRHVRHDWYRWDLAWAYFFKARTGGPIFYELALDELRKMQRAPGEPKYMVDVQLLAAACYAQLNQPEMAQFAFGNFSNSSNGKQDWTVADEDRARPFRFEADRLHLLGACKMAGLPDPSGLVP